MEISVIKTCYEPEAEAGDDSTSIMVTYLQLVTTQLGTAVLTYDLWLVI